jgi:hypothetical protein
MRAEKFHDASSIYKAACIPKKKAFFWVSSVALATLACKYGDVDLQQVA